MKAHTNGKDEKRYITMCLVKAYPSTERAQSFLENITYMKLEEDRIHIETMFGEETVVHGRVLEVDFENSKVIVEHFDM